MARTLLSIGRVLMDEHISVIPINLSLPYMYIYHILIMLWWTSEHLMLDVQM